MLKKKKPLRKIIQINESKLFANCFSPICCRQIPEFTSHMFDFN